MAAEAVGPLDAHAREIPIPTARWVIGRVRQRSNRRRRPSGDNEALRCGMRAGILRGEGAGVDARLWCLRVGSVISAVDERAKEFPAGLPVAEVAVGIDVAVACEEMPLGLPLVRE